MENNKKTKLVWVILAILAILILIIWVTRKSGVLIKSDNSLTDAQKEEILNQLRADSSNGSPELTDSQKNTMLTDLKKSSSNPSAELTAEQKAEILKQAK
ncbi:MAG: hypothetical protein QG551_175 [Patescibacteria group bacterium]|jgi:hypothetical protein|nr:hypothetical protein [Patescibacteria group bacterium]